MPHAARPRPLVRMLSAFAARGRSGAEVETGIGSRRRDRGGGGDAWRFPATQAARIELRCDTSPPAGTGFHARLIPVGPLACQACAALWIRHARIPGKAAFQAYAALALAFSRMFALYASLAFTLWHTLSVARSRASVARKANIQRMNGKAL